MKKTKKILKGSIFAILLSYLIFGLNIFLGIIFAIKEDSSLADIFNVSMWFSLTVAVSMIVSLVVNIICYKKKLESPSDNSKIE